MSERGPDHSDPPRSGAASGRPVSQQDVADAAGVSAMTVSRVLRGKGHVSDQVRSQVIQVAREMGYVPNKIAGGLASNQSNMIAVLLPSMSNMVFPEVMEGMSDRFAGSGLQSMLGLTDYDLHKEETVLYRILAWRPAAVILVGLNHTPRASELLRDLTVPVVEIMDADGDGIDTVIGVSHLRAGRDMAQEVVRQGYRKVGFIGSTTMMDDRARNRREGFRSALEGTGCEVVAEAYYEGPSSLSKGRDITHEILAQYPEIDFLYFSSDAIAAGGLMECLASGIAVPGRVGLAGFNGVELLNGLPLQLATTNACRKEIGRCAAETVLERLADPERAPERIEFDPQIDFGQTLLRQ